MKHGDIIEGDCIEEMKEMPTKSIHAVVTDPPYNISYMSKKWDDLGSGIDFEDWNRKWATQAFRLLKPGGHMMVFSGTKTFHRMMTGIEDAGFELRDTILWLYGDGFPKNFNVPYKMGKEHGEEVASEWEGFGTALKPAYEPIAIFRKPIKEKSVVDQILATGTGALNIDESRIPLEGDENLDGGGYSKDGHEDGYHRPWMDDNKKLAEANVRLNKRVEKAEDMGRYPANIALDEEAAEMVDQDNQGESHASTQEHDGYGDSTIMSGESNPDNQYSDSGGPSRFFYTSRTSREQKTMGGRVENDHPTVKPVDLMQWVLKMATAKRQTVLDPFGGSGTTLLAGHLSGREVVTIEREPESVEIARERFEIAKKYGVPDAKVEDVSMQRESNPNSLLDTD